MANAGPNTNGSQFFFMLAPCPSLDGLTGIYCVVEVYFTFVLFLIFEEDELPSTIMVHSVDMDLLPCLVKDLEKAIADSYPNSMKKIEPIIKKNKGGRKPECRGVEVEVEDAAGEGDKDDDDEGIKIEGVGSAAGIWGEKEELRGREVEMDEEKDAIGMDQEKEEK
ncbi:uncharacterized protein [Pyrus communis]|uniref:uncharacterized protein n=1 Tax=Pyrus communis TaxID=23211 RepID=UPI0035C16FB3